MIRIVDRRGSGKTTKLIELAVKDNAVIVVPALRCIENIRYLAEKLGYKDKVKCITFLQFMQNQTARIIPPEKYYIDELDWCLSILGVDGYSNSIGEEENQNGTI